MVLAVARCVTLTLLECHGTRRNHDDLARFDRVLDPTRPALLLLLLLLRRDDNNALAYFGHCSSGERLNGHVEVKYYINQNK